MNTGLLIGTIIMAVLLCITIIIVGIILGDIMGIFNTPNKAEMEIVKKRAELEYKVFEKEVDAIQRYNRRLFELMSKHWDLPETD